MDLITQESIRYLESIEGRENRKNRRYEYEGIPVFNSDSFDYSDNWSDSAYSQIRLHRADALTFSASLTVRRLYLVIGDRSF
jgi:hypothetical protein